MMDEATYQREKLRRGLQEALNAVDEAIAAEGTPEQDEKDTLILLALAPLNLTFRATMEKIMPQLQTKPEGGA